MFPSFYIRKKWFNCPKENDLPYFKRFIYNKNGQVAFGEMKYSNKNGLCNSETM